MPGHATKIKPGKKKNACNVMLGDASTGAYLAKARASQSGLLLL
jgi:hypothetical protein